jgi:tetraacyldisaccharide 4'-kinase
MDQQTARDILSGRRGGVGAAALRAALRGASWPYAGAMRLRRWAYRRGVLGSQSAAVPIISVGNLTVGGTGKTPMVAWIVARLQEAGKSPAILIRGYRATPSPGTGVPGTPVSDEAELLRSLTGVPVLANPDRIRGAASAARAGANVLVMDDGFQHRRLRRDLDIVLIDAVQPLGYGHCLPRGLLREPTSALRDADVIVITHADEVPAGDLQLLRDRLRRLAPRAIFAAAAHVPAALIDDAGARRGLDALAGRGVYAFCGLGAPEHFRATLDRLGLNVRGFRTLDDHAAYTPALLAEFAAEAARAGAEVLLTTQKDHVKLSWLASCPMPLWQLAVQVAVTQGEQELAERVLRV